MSIVRASWLPAVVLLVVSVCLAGIDRMLRSNEIGARDMSGRVGRLIGKDERDKIPLAAISIAIGEHEKFTYAKVDDRWRILDGRNAPADAEAIERLWNSLLEGEGSVHSTDPNRLAQYGFSASNVIRIELHGPELLKKKDKDVRYRCELGNRIPEIDGCFVRRPNDSSVWSISSDPRGLIESARTGALPPLVEGTLVSRTWMQSAGQIETVTIEAAGAPPLVLKLEQLQIEMEEMKKGKDPFRWTARSGAAEVPVDSRTTMAFFSALMSGKATAIDLPSNAGAAGIDTQALTGAAKITFAPAANAAAKPSAPCSLVLSAPRADGSRSVWNSESKVLFIAGPELASLCVPTAADLAVADAENKWQSYLSQQQQASMPAPSIETPPGQK